MATTTFSQATATVSNTNLSWYGKLVQKLEFSYFGLIASTITIGSIIGGIAAMYVLQNNAPIWQLALCMTGAMANNVSAIGQAPTRWVTNIFIGNLVLQTLLILVNVM